MNRVTPIDARMLERFEQGYAARPELNVMSNAVSRTALPDAAFVPAAAVGYFVLFTTCCNNCVHMAPPIIITR